ncbi:phosphotransferase [Geodermatophilus ruber]|uniref:Phosphotransferase enzyme family protein n=1 Tax=Geodermatophilus ruber TaxID=504800 RepID=A0A1I4AQ41_9ACTN|nr:phosphotransferase [Geodermatophilus ruber]SFK58393.1 Phosphotransferase enzyme family protein [Geodermatophilus ruber]
MTRTESRTQSRQVKEHQVGRAERVCRPAFLDRYVRPHLGAGAPDTGGTWTTKVIQLDGTGAATVQVELDGGAPVFAKLFPFDDGPAVHAKLQALRAAGLGAGSRYQAVEPLAWYGDEKVLLCRGAPGRPLSELLGGDDEQLAAATARAGAWLASLHGSDLRIGPPQSLLVTGELTSLAKRLAKVAADHPGYVDAALGMLERLDGLTRDTTDGVLAQSHGQYRPIHVFLTEDVVTVIDLDRSAPADPARDVAEFLHRLRLGVHSATGEIGRADRSCTAFLDAYRQAAGGDRALGNLRFHWARYVLHSLNRKIKTGEADWRDGGNAEFGLYRNEFDRIVAGRAGA